MQRQSPRSVLALAIVALLAPSAAASWNSFGTFEPDNALDDDTFMWPDAPEPGEVRVYFNAWTGFSIGIRGLTASPNVGLLQTSNHAPAAESQMAMLGVWVDCNGDGYVGLAETAAREYPAELLLDDSVCPLITGPTDAWTEGAHNYNGWVSEYVPIAGISNGISGDESDLRVYRDAEAMIWSDDGKPTDAADAGGSCALAPQPRGTYQSTGGAINYADCSTGLMEAYNTPFFGRRFAGQDIPGAGDPLGLAFPNDDDARGTMYDLPTFGTEDSSRSFVYVVDCSSEPIFNSGATINETTGPDSGLYELDDATVGSGIWSIDVREPAPVVTSDPTAATLPATVNETNEELNLGGTGSDCDTSNDAGHDFYGNTLIYVGESDFQGVSATDKRAAGTNFQFQNWGRGTDLLGFGNITEPADPVPGIPYPTLPLWGGAAGFASPTGEYSNWNGGVTTTNAGVPGRYVRADLNEGTAAIPDATYFTFYAHVGAATTSKGFLLPGGSGVYGSSQCQGADSGVHAGWNCDRELWYIQADGTPEPEVTPFARPGDAYELRDVDCQDGGNMLGVPTSSAALGPDPCDRL